MANSRTIAQVLGEISVLYPLMFSPTPEMTQVWKLYLRDLDDELLINALHHYVATAKDNYPPSVPGLRKAASDLKRMAANVPSTAEAWGAIMESFQRTSFDQPALIKNPIVQEAIHCMGGIAEIGRSENSMAERAHFMKIYEGIVGKLTEEDRELPEVKKYIEKIKQPPLLELTGDGGRTLPPVSDSGLRPVPEPGLPRPVPEPGLPRRPSPNAQHTVPSRTRFGMIC